MSVQFSLPYKLPPVSLLSPAADAAGRSSPYRNLRNADKAWVVCRVNQGNAAPVPLTLSQAQDVAGTGAKALNAVPIWLNNATASSDQLVVQAAAAAFSTDATVADKIVVFEVLPQACMDIANGYRTIGVTTGASNAANITEATLILLADYSGQNPPSSYSN